MVDTPPVEDKPIPLWQTLTVIGYVVAVIGITVGLGIACGWEWLWQRILADFWPLDNAHVAPNILASVIQYTVIAIAVVLLWPTVRRRIHKFVDAKVQHVKDHVTESHRKLAAHVTAEHDAIHERFDHLHEHLKIPPLPEGKGVRPPRPEEKP